MRNQRIIIRRLPVIILLLGFAARGAFAGTCVGGPTPGTSCADDAQCGKACAGGASPGALCTLDSQCGKACTGGPTPGSKCALDSEYDRAYIGVLPPGAIGNVASE